MFDEKGNLIEVIGLTIHNDCVFFLLAFAGGRWSRPQLDPTSHFSFLISPEIPRLIGLAFGVRLWRKTVSRIGFAAVIGNVYNQSSLRYILHSLPPRYLRTDSPRRDLDSTLPLMAASSRPKFYE